MGGNMRKTVIVFLAAAVLPGCSSMKLRTDADAMTGVKSVEIRDKTSPVKLQATDARLIADLIDTALKAKGYQTCRAPCLADATATVVVTKYVQGTSYNPIKKMAYPSVAIVFTFQMQKADTVVMDATMSKKSSVQQNELAEMLVQQLTDQIPDAR